MSKYPKKISAFFNDAPLTGLFSVSGYAMKNHANWCRKYDNASFDTFKAKIDRFFIPKLICKD